MPFQFGLPTGLNVGLDNIKLKLAPPDNNAPYVAVYHAVGDLANGVMLIAGGVIYDWLTGHDVAGSVSVF